LYVRKIKKNEEVPQLPQGEGGEGRMLRGLKTSLLLLKVREGRSSRRSFSERVYHFPKGKTG